MRIPGSSKRRKKLPVCKISALRVDFLWKTWKLSFFDYCGQFLILAPFGLILLYFCGKMCRSFWAEMHGKRAENGENIRAQYPGTPWPNNENMKWLLFCLKLPFLFWNGQANLKNWTETNPKHALERNLQPMSIQVCVRISILYSFNAI